MSHTGQVSLSFLGPFLVDSETVTQSHLHMSSSIKSLTELHSTSGGGAVSVCVCVWGVCGCMGGKCVCVGGGVYMYIHELLQQ